MAVSAGPARNRAWDVFFSTLWLLAVSVPFALALGLSAPRPSPSPSSSPSAADVSGADEVSGVQSAKARRGASAVSAASAAAAGGAPVRPVASVKQLMAGVIDPAADAVWECVGTIISAAGTEERRPRTDKEWEGVRNAALHLTEGGNLLMLGDRAKDHDAWWRMSRALVDAGAVALKAAEEKNVQALFDAGDGITAACDTCHGVYWIYQEPGAAAAKPSARRSERHSPNPSAASSDGRGVTRPIGSAGPSVRSGASASPDIPASPAAQRAESLDARLRLLRELR